MLKRINSIKNLGIFRDFSWDQDMRDFERDNLIYGWNYSGKTTLSNLFRILEIGKNHTGMNDLSFELELTDGSKITEQNIESHNLNIRVFNKEYVEETFGRFEGARVHPIYVAFGEDKKVKEGLDKKREELNKKQKNLEEKEKSIKEGRDKLLDNTVQLNKYESDQARNIRSQLKLEQNVFKKNHLRDVLREETSLISDEKVLQAKFTEYRQTAQKEVSLDKGAVDISEDVIQEIKNFLSQKVSLTEVIEELKDNTQKREWAQTGLALHKDTDVCSFCVNTISPERVEMLESFFSNAYKGAQEQAARYEEYLNNVVQGIGDTKFPAKNDFIESKRQDFERLNCEQLKADYLQKVQEILDLVRQKGEDVTKEVSTDTLGDSYVFDLNGLKQLVRENNAAIDNLTTTKEKIKEELIAHFVGEVKVSIEQMDADVEKAKTNIKKLEGEKRGTKGEIVSINKEIKKLEASASSMDAGLDKVNRVIQEFLGHNELTLEKVSKSDDIDVGEKFVFLLKRGSMPAKDLSEGEKTIISFAYFFVKLNSIISERQNNVGDGEIIGNMIVFLDDPISSFDDQHLSYMASFILNNLQGKCKQLFVSTHNFTFFDSLRTSKWHKDKDRIDRKFFIEARKVSADSDDRVAELKDLPKLIDEHKSEYTYMFKLIYDFSKEVNPNNFLMFPSIPNAFRNFLETYRSIHYPGESQEKQLKRFIKDESENIDDVLIKQIISESNKGSHSSGADSTKPQLDNPATWQEMIKKVLGCIQNNTTDHFECLKESVKKNT